MPGGRGSGWIVRLGNDSIEELAWPFAMELNILVG